MVKSVRLGVMPPITGLVELYGPEISWAAHIACLEVNEQGGVLGRPLELIIEDDGSVPETAVPAALKLINEHKCSAIIGNLLSNSRISVANRVANPLKVPYLNFSFYEGGITGDYFFSFSALPNQQIDKMIPYMAERFGPKFFFAGNNYEWPRGSVDAAIRAVEKCGGEVVGEEYFEIGTDDFTALLNNVGKSGANVFVPYAAGSDQFNLLTQFTGQGLKSRMAVVMGHYDEAMARLLPAEVREGFFSSNTYFMSIDNEHNQNYLERLSKLPGVTGISPHGNGVLTNFGEGTYLCVKAFAKAANMAQSLESDRIIQFLENIQVEGPQGTVIMDPVSHHAHVNTYLSRCNADGTFSIEKSFGLISPETPERYKALPVQDSIALTSDERVTRLELDKGRNTIAVILTDRDSNVLSVNRYGYQLWGNELIKASIGQHLSTLFQGYLPLELINYTLEQNEIWEGEVTLTFGRRRQILDLTIESTNEIDDAFSGMIISCSPTTSARRQEKTHSKILDIADVSIIAVNEEAEIIQANLAATRLFGYPKSEMIGLSLETLLPPHLRLQHAKYFSSFINSDESEREMGKRGEISGYKKDGSFFPAEATISKFTGPSGKTMIATLRDISARKKSEEALVWRATHDPLTSLPNRNLILERTENALKRAQKGGGVVALMFIDIDEFKLINDNHGHGLGDEFLKTISQRLLDHVRPGDTVARFGGDEFLVLCDQVSDHSEIANVAEEILGAVKQPVSLDGRIFFPSVSIGVSVGYGITSSTEELMKHADAAMYDVKTKGRDGWCFFNNNIRLESERHLMISNGLQMAIQKNELEVYFQPIVDIQEMRVAGAEALVRWKHGGEFISPAEFIPISELNGLIVPIGEWIFRQSCRSQQQWVRKFGRDSLPYVSINLSGRQLNSMDLVQRFLDIIAEYGLSPENVVLEITETTMMTDVKLAEKILHAFGDNGLRLAIDDFGTGYSSLNRIVDLPVKILKVDRDFVKDINTIHTHKTITAAVTDMAHRLGLKITAEGAETPQELEVLNALDCDCVQGYYFSKPLPEHEFIEFLGTFGQEGRQPQAV